MKIEQQQIQTALPRFRPYLSFNYGAVISTLIIS